MKGRGSQQVRNPFVKNFRREYELALKVGKEIFGSECKHTKVRNGRCVHCLRKVISR